MPCYKIYEDEKTMAFLNIYPMSKGAALIVPKNHASDMAEGSKDDAVAMMETLYKVAPIIMDALGANSYNLGMNHGKGAGQEVFHTHLHFIPRYKDVERSFERYEASKEELEEVAEKIWAKFE